MAKRTTPGTKNGATAPTDSSVGRHSRFEIELRRGVIQMVALRLLRTARYGYDLIRLLGSAGFSIEEGTLYPLLRRFEKNGLVTSRWDTEGSRPRKYYQLSEEGANELAEMLDAWSRVNVATGQALCFEVEADQDVESTSTNVSNENKGQSNGQSSNASPVTVQGESK